MTYQLTCFQYYAPDYELDVRPSNMDNANSKEYLDKIRIAVLENLKKTTFAPSVQMTDVPREGLGMNDDEEDALDDQDEDQNPDVRTTQRRFDQRVEHNGELDDSEDEEMAEANGVRKDLRERNRRAEMNFRPMQHPIDSGVDSGMGTPQADSSQPDRDVEMEELLGMNVAPEETAEAGPSEAAIESAKPSPPPKVEDDVTMTDAEPAPESGVPDEPTSAPRLATPPESPPEAQPEPSSTVVDQDSTTIVEGAPEVKSEVDAAVAEEEGLREKAEEDAAGQARTEAASS